MTQAPRQDVWGARGAGYELRLFCFPHAGGNSSMFKEWGRHLPAAVKVHGVELPGRQGRFREPLVERVARLVPQLVRELKPLLTPSLALFGHSVGALIAFEFARELRREGLPAPAHLFVSGYGAPQLPQASAPIHKLSEPLFLNRVSHLLPREVLSDRELLSAVLPILRADCALSETYQYAWEPPLDCPITALGGMWDMRVSRIALNLWRQQTRRGFSLHLFPGDHSYPRAVPERLLETMCGTLGEYAWRGR